MKMNAKNKQMQEVFDYFNRRLGENREIDSVNVSYEDISPNELHYSLPDNKATQRAMDVVFSHGAEIPDEAKAYVGLATTSGRSRGVYSFPRTLECPAIARNIPGLENAVRLFEDTPTEARICVYPTNGCLGDLLDVYFDGEQITGKKAGTPGYEYRLDIARNMREVVDIAFNIYNS